MSYDLHGTWNKGNDWVGPYLNAHTNLTEITEALDLLWRNNISSDKVVLGMVFYGRAFTVSNLSCTKLGRTYASGGKKRSCSGEVSVILNSEIDQVVVSMGAKSILYEEEAVKVLNYEGNQWVAYDDKETFKLKADFARGQCLGGLMVWAVSYDTKDAKYTAALAEAANRKFVAALPATDDSVSTTRDKHAQCKWTNCGEREFHSNCYMNDKEIGIEANSLNRRMALWVASGPSSRRRRAKGRIYDRRAGLQWHRPPPTLLPP